MVQKTYQRRKTLNTVRRYAREFVDFIESEGVRVNKAYLYGSYVRGTARPWSDIDICIVSSQFRGPSQALSYLWKRRRGVDVERGIEPVGYRPKDFQIIESPLVWDISVNGLKIK